jgi:hypothetical protein
MGPVAPLLAMMIAATSPSDRVLVCRASLAGDPALARGEAVAEGVRELGARALDYGVPCESVGEAARAARRAGLLHAIVASAEGRTDGSTFELTVVDLEGRALAVRRLTLPPGADVARPVGAGLAALVDGLPRPLAERARRRASVGVAGGGIALIAGGIALAFSARAEAERANAAATPLEYLDGRRAWQRARGWSAAALGVGGAALGAGIVWRFRLPGEEP